MKDDIETAPVSAEVVRALVDEINVLKKRIDALENGIRQRDINAAYKDYAAHNGFVSVWP